LALLLLLPALLPLRGRAADTPPAGKDVLVFTNGDQLTGTLQSESGGSVVFKGDLAGTVTVPWKNIKSLKTGNAFAVIRSGQKLKVGRPAPQVPQGTLAATSEQVEIAEPGGATRGISTSDAAYIVSGAEFDKVIAREPSLKKGWAGAVTLGATTVEATQTGETLTGAVTLARTEPGVDWLEPRNKTIFDATATYGILSQPYIAGVQDASSVRTNILHGDFERDQYVSPRLYYLFEASADHNIGSGLRVQQIYGGGAGFNLVKQPMQTLDLKGDIHYQRQEFYPSATTYPGGDTLNLIGATIGEIYMRKLAHGFVLNENGTILPAFNTPAGEPSAWSALAAANLVVPAYKNFGFSIGLQDNYVNNPPTGFHNNTFQFTAGVTYTIK
jgi:hypothetical protein